MGSWGMWNRCISGMVWSALFVCVYTACSYGASFVVNSEVDSPDANPGDGSAQSTGGTGMVTLRSALEEANALPGADTITFEAGITIAPSDLGELPPLDDSSAGTTIDATGQTVTLSGAFLSTEFALLKITSADNVVKGLSIVQAGDGGGIQIAGTTAQNNTVVGCRIGLDWTDSTTQASYGPGIWIKEGASSNRIGDTTSDARNIISGSFDVGVRITDIGTEENKVLGNYIGLNAAGDATHANAAGGVHITSGASRNIIGGPLASERNIISGNLPISVGEGAGVVVEGSGTTGNVVEGNYIGLDPTGATAFPNLDGVLIRNSATTNIVRGNLIAGNQKAGVLVSGLGSDQNVIVGNRIGLKANGAEALPNVDEGVRIIDGAKENIVGGDKEELRNVISGNDKAGVEVLGAETTDNVVMGNYIGLSVDGLQAIPNVTGCIINQGQKNTIGGTEAGMGNLISGNQTNGVQIEGNATENTVIGNQIGVDSAGGPLGNGGEGVAILGGNNTQIGGNLAGTPNLIAYNANNGVYISSSTSVGNRVQQNAIHSNALEGIVLAEGGNNSVSPPTLTDLLAGVSTFDATIEFFVDDDNEGRIFLGELSATADTPFNGAFDLADYVNKNLTATATDLSGNTSQFSSPLFIDDRTPPVIVLNGESNVLLECGDIFNDPGVASATDNLDGDLSTQVGRSILLNDESVESIDSSNLAAIYELVYSVIDTAGNIGESIRTITIVDTTQPELVLIGAATLTLECGSTFNDPGATANDTCDGDVSANIEKTGTVDTNAPGQYTISYNVVDSGANYAQQVVRTVNVVDTTAPQITLQGNTTLTLECGSTFTDPGATANDICDGDLSTSITKTGTVNTNAPGQYTLIYNVSDNSGNSAPQVARTVNVLDTTAPQITLLGNTTLTLECGSTFTDPGATATDTCEGDLSTSITKTGTVNTNAPGQYTINYNVFDSSENYAQQVVRTVNVIDTTPPQITLLGEETLTLECGTTFTDPGVTANDICDGDLSTSITKTGTVDTSSPGQYTINYNLIDSSANYAQQVVRTVNVVDTTPPQITLLGEETLTLECGTTFTDPGVTANDICDGDLSTSITKTGTVNTNAPGQYTINYNVFDSSANYAQQVVRTVNVVDTTAPQITLQGENPYILPACETYVDPGASATDTCSGTCPVSSSSNVDSQIPGTYRVVYAASDPTGNRTVSTRTVVVNECTIEGEGGGEGAVEGEEEGSVEGQPEGAVEGEGEGNTEGELEACLAACSELDFDEDKDGDGLSACEEACYGTSDYKTDSDSDGMPDPFEVRFGLDPLSFDADADPDGDTLSNLEEFLENASPIDADSPIISLFVAPPPQGYDAPERGSLESPLATVGYALSILIASESRPLRIVVLPGTYEEDFVMKPWISVEGYADAETTIYGTVVGANHARLSNLTLIAASPQDVLLSIGSVVMTVRHVLFLGTEAQQATGILCEGNTLDALIDGCAFESVSIGIEIAGSSPTIRRCVFRDYATAAIYIHESATETGSMGDSSDANSGWNTFENIPGTPAVRNDSTIEFKMENNDWGTEDEAEIQQRISGVVDYQPFLATGSGILAAAVYCTLWDALTSARILDASVTLTPSAYAPVTDNVDGVYAFPALPGGVYTVQIEAPGYITKGQSINVDDGKIASISIPLTPNGTEGEEEGEGETEGEGEGEGEEEPDDGCGCFKDTKGLPTQGDILVTGLSLIVMLGYRRRFRW